MEAAQAQSCAVFISSAERIAGWQNEQMRAAIQTRVEDGPGYRVILVRLPGADGPIAVIYPAFHASVNRPISRAWSMSTLSGAS